MTDSRNNISRRDFFKVAGVAGIGSVLGAGNLLAQEGEATDSELVPDQAGLTVPRRTFGKIRLAKRRL